MQKVILKGVDEKPLHAHIFEPIKPNGTVVVICPATGVKQRYYQNFAEYAAEANFTVVTFDYQGIGESRPPRLKGFNCGVSDWAENNINQVVDHVKEQIPYQCLVIMGHSIGGQLVGLCHTAHEADGLVLVASQSGYWKMWPWPQRWKMWFNWRILIPAMTASFGYLPARRFGIMEDLPRKAAREWAAWCLSPNHLFDHKHDAEASFASLKKPMVSYSFSDDGYAPKGAVDFLLRKYLGCEIKDKHFTPDQLGVKKIGHFGFFKKTYQAFFWDDVLGEIRQMTGNKK